ncbi:MAG: hypothetical protein SCARUB_01337 [Candidatus Scalindua rubra]|uniref:Uncharacterized protein n=1 Tax=Candidatus Scalindua rubra TaxID=1872076 RepID=A0A1E3XD16_9BACT|nr:MAG: hypothetical protein SCARUB_01337 [Candidatus Scalindua rubra]
MKYGTGRGARVKHSTGLDMTRLDEIRRRVKRLRHSTGGESSLVHATGKEMDYKYEYDKLVEEEEKLSKEEQLKVEPSA